MLDGFIAIAFTLFIVLNSTGNIPLFIAMLGRFDQKKRLWIIFRELFIALCILLLFTFFGEVILDLLGITQAVIGTAGGVLLFLISLTMIFPKPKTTTQEALPVEPLIIPLAIPIIAGPGSISMVMTYAGETGRPIYVAGALFVAWLFSLTVLLLSSTIKHLLGEKGLSAIERLGGMLICLIGTSMFVNGTLEMVKEFFKI